LVRFDSCAGELVGCFVRGEIVLAFTWWMRRAWAGRLLRKFVCDVGLVFWALNAQIFARHFSEWMLSSASEPFP
jgi:hypothetical protein